MEDRINEEAKAFDLQILERIENGHIPDIRLVKPCDYFYNNSWRRPEYVRMNMGKTVNLVINSIHEHCGEKVNVLEVGCGPGYASLEIARNGFNVIGIDISSECIKVANKFSEEDPWIDTRGSLEYIKGNIFDCEELKENYFHAVVFIGSLHHIKKQEDLMKRVSKLLKSDGIVVVNEPTRDRVTEGNIFFVHLLRTLLSLSNGYYEKVSIPEEFKILSDNVDKILLEMKYEYKDGSKKQSINDNEAGYYDMYKSLTKHYKELEKKERSSFFHQVIGGLRFDEETNIKLARYLIEMDRKFCELGVLQSTEFFFVGRKLN